MDDTLDPRMAVALYRYEVIAAYLAAGPARGQRGPLLAQLAARTWTDPRGRPQTFSAETLRAWVRRYRRAGLPGLEDHPRPHRGVQALTPEQVELVCGLKREVPERSLERVIHIAESLGLIAPGALTRSTLHRVLRARGLSRRPDRVPDAQDLDRFEAAFPNALWQSDMLEGPWLPDPERPGKLRRAHLYAFLDDHSRLLLYGRFSFKGDLPALELVFRQALRKWGKPRRVYYDNGAVYRSLHMQRIVAELGLQRIIHTRAYRPMGHGKIEAFNRFVRAAFLAELRVSGLQTLDALNEAFTAWADHDYNRRTHSETGACPLDRWRAGVDRIVYAEEEALRRAFLWSEPRTPDKAGVFGLFGTRYQVGPGLARKRVDVRFDPEHLAEVEVWHQGRFVERVRPFQVQPHRRPRPEDDAEASATAPKPGPKPAPTADWLGHLVRTRRQDALVHHPRALVQAHADQRAHADQAFLDLLYHRLDPAVVDAATVHAWLDRFGPFDSAAAAAILDVLLAHEPNDRHVTFYLDAIRRLTSGDIP